MKTPHQFLLFDTHLEGRVTNTEMVSLYLTKAKIFNR